MANIIVVTTFTSPSQALNGDASSHGKTATTRAISVGKIISVKTRATAYLTTGITDVLYEYRLNSTIVPVLLICTEAQAAIVTAANA